MLFLLISISQPFHLIIYHTIFSYSLKTHAKRMISIRKPKGHIHRSKPVTEVLISQTYYSSFDSFSLTKISCPLICLLQFTGSGDIFVTLFWMCIYIDTSATTLVYKCYAIMPNLGVSANALYFVLRITLKCLRRPKTTPLCNYEKPKIQQVCNILVYHICKLS